MNAQSEDTNRIWNFVVDEATRSISAAGFTAKRSSPYVGAIELEIGRGRKRPAVLQLIRYAACFDAQLKSNGRIIAGRSSVRFDWVDVAYWTMADVDRGIRLLSAGMGLIPEREIPGNFVLSALVSDVARLHLPAEEPIRWGVASRTSARLVREARDIANAGDFDRERNLRFVRQLVQALPKLSAKKNDHGLLMMARRCQAALVGEKVFKIHDWEWTEPAFIADRVMEPEQHDAEPAEAPAPAFR